MDLSDMGNWAEKFENDFFAQVVILQKSQASLLEMKRYDPRFEKWKFFMTTTDLRRIGGDIIVTTFTYRHEDGFMRRDYVGEDSTGKMVEGIEDRLSKIAADAKDMYNDHAALLAEMISAYDVVHTLWVGLDELRGQGVGRPAPIFREQLEIVSQKQGELKSIEIKETGDPAADLLKGYEILSAMAGIRTVLIESNALAQSILDRAPPTEGSGLKIVHSIASAEQGASPGDGGGAIGLPSPA
ncbi:hypothetical protein [Cupriavidus sp. CP313]